MFDKIENSKCEEKILGTETRGSSDVPENKAARASMAAAMTEKVSAAFSSSDALGDMFKHLRTGAGGPEPKPKPKPKPNKNKKTLTPEQQRQRDFDKSLEKTLGLKHASSFASTCFECIHAQDSRPECQGAEERQQADHDGHLAPGGCIP